MARRSAPIRIDGEQRAELEADLTAQLVLLLGRQLAREADGAAPDATVLGDDEDES